MLVVSSLGFAMRVLVAAILLSGLTMQSAHARLPVPEQSNNASSLSSQTPFRMPASEQKTLTENPSWTAPQIPLRIYGNTWYVGPHGLGVFLITARAGDVLIDGGVPGDATLIERNIRNVGVNLHDVKWILNSHGHFDHAGGIAQLAHDTGAQVIAGAADIPLLEGGGHNDPEYGDRFPFPPVHVALTVTDGEKLHLGDLMLTAHSTPGHTKGNMTWTWISCESKRCLNVVDVGSLSAPGYQLIGNPKYPNIAQDFDRSFKVAAALPCDIALAPHPGAVNFWERVAKREQGDGDALISSTGCQTYAKEARDVFNAQMEKQQAGAGSTR